MNVQVRLPGTEHWTNKGQDVKLFLWNKVAGDSGEDQRHDPVRTWLLDGLTADVRPRRAGPAGFSAMEYFAGRLRRWTVDMEGYGRSKRIATTMRRLRWAPMTARPPPTYITTLRGPRPLLVYGISSGALRAALFAQRTCRDASAGSRSTPWSGPARIPRP